MMFLYRNFEAIVSSAAFAVMLAMVTLNVILRYLFGSSLLFTEEIAYLGFAYAVFFGACLLYRKRALIAVDFLVEMFPVPVQRVVTVVNLVLLFATNLYMTYLSWLLADGSWTRRTSFLEFPYFYMYMAATLSFLIMSFHTARFLVEALRGAEMRYAGALDQR